MRIKVKTTTLLVPGNKAKLTSLPFGEVKMSRAVGANFEGEIEISEAELDAAKQAGKYSEGQRVHLV